MTKNKNNITLTDVANSVDDLAVLVKKEFEQIDQRFEQIDQRFEQIDQRFEQIDQRFNRIESTMVTKDYLDEKLSDLRGDLVVLIRKEDHKVVKLVEILKEKNILKEDDVNEILKLEPFARPV